MTLLTTKHGFPKPEATEAPDGPTQIGALGDAIDEKIVVWLEGTSLPASGIEGRVFYHTGTNELWYDTSEGWKRIAPYGDLLPRARGTGIGVQAYSAGISLIEMDSGFSTPSGIFDFANKRFVFPVAGIWAVTFRGGLSLSGSFVEFILRKNGAANTPNSVGTPNANAIDFGYAAGPGASQHSVLLHAEETFNVNDTVDVQARSDGAFTMNGDAGVGFFRLAATYLGPAS